MFRVVISALLMSALASATSHALRFVGSNRQVATLAGAVGHRSLAVTVGGDPRLGAGTQADCELRAVESGRSWHLIPFKSDTMEIDAADVHGVHFSLRPMGNRAFRLETDFGEKNCAAGLSFSGTYRRHRI